MDVFEAQGIRKTYGETKAVDGVDLSLSAGEIVTILGHNGSGKTTFLECVEGLRKPDAGTVTLCGKVHAYGSPLPEGVGVQMQQEQLPPRIKVREALSLFASIYGVDGPPPDLMQAMTIETIAGKRFDTLSGGQKRRVSLVLAFMGDPRIVFLDEPTAGLDPEARSALVAVLKDRRDRGLTVLATLHEVDHAADLADRILIMARGRVRREGTVDSLMSTLGADACVVLPRGTDQAPWQAAGHTQLSPEGALLVFGDRSTLERAVQNIPSGRTAVLRPTNLGDVVTREAQKAEEEK